MARGIAAAHHVRTARVLAAHCKSRSAAATASAGTSRAFERKSCRAPVISTTSVGAAINAAASRTSAGVPKGSDVPWVKTVGTRISGRCSVRRRSGYPGGWTG
jgi:hypothetical protein